MPIYAYRCEACGFAKDVLQKMSDAPLSVCPECEKATFRKQLSAAGFQLKGSGWYATDFRGNGAGASGAASSAAATSSTSENASAPPASSDSAAPSAAGCGGSCACH